MLITRAMEAAMICRQTRGYEFPLLVPGLIEQGSIGMIVGPAKSRKSMLALNLCGALLARRPFLGIAPTGAPQKILYVNLELTRPALGVRLHAMGRAYPDLTRSADLAFAGVAEFLGDDMLVNVRSQSVNQVPFNRLLDAATAWGATMIVVDPLYYIVGEENDNVLVTAVLRQLGRIRDALGCTVLVVHHTRKERTDWSDPFLAGRGASSIGGFFEFVLGIEPGEDRNAATIHHGSRNLPAADPIRVQFQSHSLSWSRADAPDGPMSVLDEVMGDAVEMPTAEFYQRAEAAGLGDRDAVSRLLTDASLCWRRPKRGVPSAIVRSLQ